MLRRLLSPALLLSLSSLAALAADFSFQEVPGKHLDILSDGKIVARYMTAYDPSTKETLHDTYKPFLHVYDQAGSAPITKGPGGDFTHHRGLFLGWSKIGVNGKTYDRWHMKGGEQVHADFSTLKVDNKAAVVTSHIKWHGDTSDQLILDEQRTLSLLPAAAPYYAVVDFDSQLKALAGDTVIGGDPEHAGLQFRPAQEVDRTKTRYLYPVENADAHKDHDYPWFAESFSLRGKTYTVVYLNHPTNPKQASISAYRDYGRFGAFFKTEVKKDETFRIRARLLIAEGGFPSAEAIQQAWNAYTGETAPTPKTTEKPAEGAKKPAATPAKDKAKAKAKAEPAGVK